VCVCVRRAEISTTRTSDKRNDKRTVYDRTEREKATEKKGEGATRREKERERERERVRPIESRDRLLFP